MLRCRVVLALLVSGVGAVSAQQRPVCLLRPTHVVMPLPANGLTWLRDESLSGACRKVGTQDWQRTRSSAFDLLVHADGPEGSGRYWDVVVGVTAPGQPDAIRGVCFSASTVGWRTLQRLNDAPLPWARDVDADGRPELIVWSSFPLGDGDSMAEVGLNAWVYTVGQGTLVLDWPLSRTIAAEVATAYRTGLDQARQLQPLRDRAARALVEFAQGTCRVPEEG